MKYYEFIDVSNFPTVASTEEHFWYSVLLWNNRPNLINKRIIGCQLLSEFQLNNAALVEEVACTLQKQLLSDVFDLTADNVCDYVHKKFGEQISLNRDYDENSIVFFLKRFLPKSVKQQNKQPNLEVVILDYRNKQATFFNNLWANNETINIEKRYCYRLRFKNDYSSKQENETETGCCIVLSVQQEENSGDGISIANLNNDVDWLKGKLLPKIVKWCNSAICDEGNDNDSYELNRGSLKLVNVSDYSVLYQKLKGVYGEFFVKIWPENTDPLKYVYEDVAIATYLLLLWRQKKQNFVDLGCGNGLLVHILVSEGHTGLGIDVRSRKIWDLYPSETNLQVNTITPTRDDSCLYPDADWLIGNHSDELTPWVPVLTSMSSYRCNFFLLPCCSYELDGKKYQRQNSSKSLYMDYLDHIFELSERCGFNVAMDKLRIPSTKRICLVSTGRSYSVEKHIDKVNEIRNLIEVKCGVKDSSYNNVFGDFKPRSNEIKVKNCTQLDRSFVNELVAMIAKIVLNSSSSSEYLAKIDKNSRWNEGVPIALNELAKSLPKNYLKILKNECGGLKTLIRNHHYIFKINNGCVQFRKPSVGGAKKVSTKAKRCWFFDNHPDKCPLLSENCSYVH